MRILFLYMFPLWGNGSGSFLRELSRELLDRGHTIGIVAPDKRKLPHVKHYVVNEPNPGIFVGHPELPKAKKYADMNSKELGDIYIRYLTTSIDAVSDFNPEIIHVFHTAFLPGIARTIKILFGVKFIITTHGSDLSYLTLDRRFTGLIDDANRVARFITSNSEFTQNWYLQMFGKNLKRKSRVIAGGVRLEDFEKDQKSIDLINKKYHLTGKKVVLFTGRLTSNKGVIYLVRAAEKINGTVVIVGNGPDRANLEKEIKKLKLKNILLTGYITTNNQKLFHAFYERADVYVSPSVWEEPLGLTILEAMASHTPVVATKKGCMLSIIKDGTNGYFIRARNSKQIVEVVNMLLLDDLKRKVVGDMAYKTVVDKFTWAKIAIQFEDIYKQFKYTTAEYITRVTGTNTVQPGLLQKLRRSHLLIGKK